MLGALGDIEGAQRYLAQAFERDSVFSGQVLVTKLVLEARQGILGDVDEALKKTAPMGWWRVKLVAAYAMAVNGNHQAAMAMRDEARRELLSLGFVDFESLGEGRIAAELDALLELAPATAAGADAPMQPLAVAAAAARGVRLTVMGGPIAVLDSGQELAVPAGNPQRLVGVIVASGGSVSIDQASEALWGDDDVERSRTRLRNVLLRLRRAVGDVVVRTGNGLRLGPDVSCDLYDFRRQAEDAPSTAGPIPSWRASWRHAW